MSLKIHKHGWLNYAAQEVGIGGGGGSLLLDTLSASAVCAYSTRKLRSAYAGKALAVYNTTTTITTDIGFSGNDLDTVALAAAAGVNTCFVVTWYDQSGNGNNAIAPTTSTGPTIVSSGTNNTLNGHVAINSLGLANSYMTYTISRAQPNTVALVGKMNSFITGAHFTDGATASPRQIIGCNSSTVYNFYAGSSVATGGTLNTSAHGLVGVFNGASSVLYQDGSSIISGTNIGTQAQGNMLIFAGNPNTSMLATIPEYMVFSSTTSGTDISTLHSSWTTYWGIP